MAAQRMNILAAALFLLAATATASRDTGMGVRRELKQATPLPTVAPLPTLPAAGALPPAVSIPAVPTVPAVPTSPTGSSSDPFLSAINRMITFLQNDAASLQSTINGAAQGVNTTVSSIPLVQTFETQLATALSQLQTAISGIVAQGATLGTTAQTNVNAILSALTSRDPLTAVLQTVGAALPPAAAGR